MNEKKFLEQVYSKIKKRENLNIELKENCVEIDDGVKVNYEKVQTAPDGSKVEILAKIK